MRENKRRFKEGISDIPGLDFREITDPQGECATILTVIFPDSEVANKIAEELGTKVVAGSGWHVYSNMEQILNKLTVTPEGCPFTCPYYRGGEVLEGDAAPDRRSALPLHQHQLDTSSTGRGANSKRIGTQGCLPLSDIFGKKGIDIENLNIGGGGATPMDVHYQHEWGLKLSFIEVFSSCPCTQISIAFARGAARQYDAYWSVYHPPISYPAPTYDGQRVTHLMYNSDMKRLGGPTESMLLRCWIVAYFSGNNVNYMDGAPYVNWVEREPKKLELTPAGRNAKRFADLMLRERTERGETYVPVALMLNFYHGWTPGRGCYLRGGKDVTWYKIPFNAGDYTVENFFDVAFPDNSLMGKPRPWSTSEEYGRMLLDGFDFRPYEFRCVTVSRWGDSFDVILDNASLETLKRYKTVMLLGYVMVDAPLLDKLKRYVEDGGILLANVEQIGRECRNKEFFGVGFTDRVRKGTQSFCRVCGRRYREPEYDYTVIKSEGAEVEAVSEAGDPLIVVNRVGKGQVILTTPYYLLSYRPERKMEVPIDRMVLEVDDFPPDAPLDPQRKALIVPYNKWLNIGTHAAWIISWKWSHW